METKQLLGVTLVLLLASVAVGSVYFSDDSANCSEMYDKAVEQDIDSSEIPEECRPLPEDVEQKLLLQVLGES